MEGQRMGRLRGVLFGAVFLTSTVVWITGCILLDLAKVRATEEVEAQYACIAETVRFEASEVAGASDPSDAEWMVAYPFVVPSWRDMEPKSEFIAGLFFEDPEKRAIRRRWPDQVAFYLIFGVEDETVPVPSVARWEAVRDARERWPLVYDHTEILESEETSQRLNEILDRGLP